jgi:hypothetical protein
MKRSEKSELEEEQIKKARKSSISDTEFEERMLLIYNGLITALSVITPYGVEYVLCFTGSLLLRAFEPGGKFRNQCIKYLRWRFEERGRITDDCDVIFRNDPSADLQRAIRHHNRRANSLTIDWWLGCNYKRKWAKVKRRSLRSEDVLGYPCQPIKVLYKAKRDLLSGDIKHKNDVPHLPNYK